MPGDSGATVCTERHEVGVALRGDVEDPAAHTFFPEDDVRAGPGASPAARNVATAACLPLRLAVVLPPRGLARNAGVKGTLGFGS